MGRIAKMSISYGKASGRFIDCLQVDNEQVIIEVRPAYSISQSHGKRGSNQWMQPAHWTELYALLIDVASDHIKSSENYTDPKKGQGPLLKVLYQFKPFVQAYQDLLCPYEYHSRYPLLALENRDDFMNACLYESVLVAVVFPSEDDIKGFDNYPTFRKKNLPGEPDIEDPAAVSSSQIKAEFVPPLLSGTEVKTGNPETTQTNIDDELNSSSHETQDTNSVKAETFYSDNEDPGSSPLWRKEESTEPLAWYENNSFDSPDIFAGCEGAEETGGLGQRHRPMVGGGGCSPWKRTNLSFSGQDDAAGSSPSSPGKTPRRVLGSSPAGCSPSSDSQPSGDTVSETNQATVQTSVSEKNAWKGKVKCEEDTDSQPFPNNISGKKIMLFNEMLISKEKSNPGCACSETEDKQDEVFKIEDSLQESLDGDLQSDILNDRKEADSKSEVTFVNSMPPLSNEQRKLYMLFACGKKLPTKVDVGEDITPEETDETDQEEIFSQSPVTGNQRIIEYPSSDEIMAEAKPSKRKGTFSEFLCERKPDKNFPADNSTEPSTSFTSDVDNINKTFSESQPSFSSSFGDGQSDDASQTSRLRKRDNFGRTKTYEETSPKKETSPTAVGLPLAAQNSKDATHTDATNSSKTCKKQPIKQMQATRKSPRKANTTCHTATDGLSDSEPQNIKPKKRTRWKSSKPKIAEEPVEERVELTDNQKKLLQLYSSTEKTIVPSSSCQENPQKRVRNSQQSTSTKRKRGKKDRSSGQITDYFAMSSDSKVEALGASTSGSDLKARALEETRLMESLSKALSSEDNDSDSSDSHVPLHLIAKRLAPQSSKNIEENARFINTMKNLSLDKITKSFKRNSALFHGIFKERIPCERHNLYKAGQKERSSLRYSTATNPYSDKQLSHMMELLTKAFCQDNALHFVDYMWKVLVPEVANHVFMDEFNLDYQESLKKIHELYIASEHDSD